MTGLRFETLGQIMKLLLVTPYSLVREHAGSVGRGTFAILMRKCFAVGIGWTARCLLAQDSIYCPPSRPRQTCSCITAFIGGVHVRVWYGFEARLTGFTSFHCNTEAPVRQFVTTEQYSA